MLRLLQGVTNSRREGFKAGQPSLGRKSNISVDVITVYTDVRFQILHSILWLWVRLDYYNSDFSRANLIARVSDTQVRSAYTKVRSIIHSTTYTSDWSADYYVRVYLTNETSSTISCVVPRPYGVVPKLIYHSQVDRKSECFHCHFSWSPRRTSIRPWPFVRLIDTATPSRDTDETSS